MTTVELPDDVAAALTAAQTKLKDSIRESQEAADARVAADQAAASADQQMVEANQAAIEAQTAASAAIEKLTHYLTPKK